MSVSKTRALSTSKHLLPSENLRRLEADLVAADEVYAAAAREYYKVVSVGGLVLVEARLARKAARAIRHNLQRRLAYLRGNLRPDVPPAITRLLVVGDAADLDTCIEWDEVRNLHGYGMVYMQGKMRLAHRVSYALANSLPIDGFDGTVIRHRCDNPPCINPRHLLPGTHADNTRDMYERGRDVHNTARGSAAASSKLKESDIPAIRARLATRERRGDIAADYGVARNAIFRIQSGKTWGHV